jgi:predicted cupin superfamily sugar epimerase
VSVQNSLRDIIMPQLTAAEVKNMLHLQPHPREGGWYTRTWESPELLAPTAFTDARYPSPRRTSTAIYYLLEPHTFSEMHLLQSDEIFHHYLGSPVELLQLFPDGTSTRTILGPDLAAGHRPQLVVPRGVWQGSRLLPTSHPTAQPFALLGCTVSPGFDFIDYIDAPAAELIAKWPHEFDLIQSLTNR